MNLKADIVKALRVSLDREDSEHLAAEIMDRLPPVYAAAPDLLKALIDLIEHIPADWWTVHGDMAILTAAKSAAEKAVGGQ